MFPPQQICANQVKIQKQRSWVDTRYSVHIIITGFQHQVFKVNLTLVKGEKQKEHYATRPTEKWEKQIEENLLTQGQLSSIIYMHISVWKKIDTYQWFWVEHVKKTIICKAQIQIILIAVIAMY